MPTRKQNRKQKGSRSKKSSGKKVTVNIDVKPKRASRTQKRPGPALTGTRSRSWAQAQERRNVHVIGTPNVLPREDVRPASVRNPNPRARSAIQQAVSSMDVWETSLLMHLAEPSLRYALPGIDTFGVTYNPVYYGAAPWSPGRDTNGGSSESGAQTNALTCVMFAEATDNGVRTPIRMSENDRQLESNYFVNDGWVVGQVQLDNTANDEYTAVIGFNPTDPGVPVVVFNWASGTNVWGSHADVLPWTASPFIVRHDYRTLDGSQPWPAEQSVGRTVRRSAPASRDSSSDRWSTVSGSTAGRTGVPATAAPATPARAPEMTYDCLNYYYVGGAEMCVKVVGSNAFTAVSALSRDDLDTITRFWTTESDPNDPTQLDFGYTKQYSPGHNVAYAAYTGSKWGLSFSNTAQTDDTYLGDRLRYILNCGMPYVAFKYSVPSAQGTTPYLQITASTWLACAPTSAQIAGAATHRTVPMTLPAWASYCRARGGTGRDENAAKGGAFEGVSKRLSRVPTTSRMLDAVFRTPKGKQTLTTGARIGQAASDVARTIVETVAPMPIRAAVNAFQNMFQPRSNVPLITSGPSRAIPIRVEEIE